MWRREIGWELPRQLPSVHFPLTAHYRRLGAFTKRRLYHEKVFSVGRALSGLLGCARYPPVADVQVMMIFQPIQAMHFRPRFPRIEGRGADTSIKQKLSTLCPCFMRHPPPQTTIQSPQPPPHPLPPAPPLPFPNPSTRILPTISSTRLPASASASAS